MSELQTFHKAWTLKSLLTNKTFQASNIIFVGSRHPNFMTSFEYGRLVSQSISQKLSEIVRNSQNVVRMYSECSQSVVRVQSYCSQSVSNFSVFTSICLFISLSFRILIFLSFHLSVFLLFQVILGHWTTSREIFFNAICRWTDGMGWMDDYHRSLVV